MARKLRLKTYENWIYDYRPPRGSYGVEVLSLEITYYGHAYRIYPDEIDGEVVGVFQGVWHGPGSARKATRQFYVLTSSMELEYLDHPEMKGVELLRITLPHTKAMRRLTLTEIPSSPWRTGKQMDRLFGKKWKEWTPQHLATKLLEASK